MLAAMLCRWSLQPHGREMRLSARALGSRRQLFYTSSGTVATTIVAMTRGSKMRRGMRAARRRPAHARARITSHAVCCVPRRWRAMGGGSERVASTPPYDSRGKLRNRAKLLTDPAACPTRSHAQCARTPAEERSSDPAQPQPGSSPCSRAQRGRHRAR